MSPLPNMTDALLELGDPCTIGVIAKSPEDFEAQEKVQRFYTLYGVQVPTQPRELELMPEGERNWKYLTVYSEDTTLRKDFYVQVDGDKLQYRVVAVEPWGSFSKYLLQECPTMGSAVFTENLSAEGAA